MLKSEETMKKLLNIMDLSNIKNELTFQIRMSPGFNSGTEIFQFENGQKCCYFKQYFENGKPSTIKYLYQIYYPKYCIQNIEKYSNEKRKKEITLISMPKLYNLRNLSRPKAKERP